MNIDKELEKEYEASKTDFVVDAKAVKSTVKTSGIKLLSKEFELYNKFQILCAKCKLDDKTYGLIYDTNVRRAFTVELIYKNGQLKSIRDLDSVTEDEEWQVITEYFNDLMVSESKIMEWYVNQLVPKKLMRNIPQDVLNKIKDNSSLSKEEYQKRLNEIKQYAQVSR